MAEHKPILTIDNLHVTFRSPDGPVHAVRGVSMQVARGETIAVVGESGSGKSQIMLSTMGLLASNGSASGSVDYRGTELLTLTQRELNQYRGVRLSMIFQEPMTSLDPLYRIGRQIAEPLVHHGRMSARDARARVLELLDLVGIPEPAHRLRSYPHELSGGQRQRVMIAMALANDPDILIADEPTTALDVTIQAQVLQLLADLQSKLGMAIVFVTHDLGIVRRLADRTYVMHDGNVVETGRTADIFDAPAHAYTKKLLDAEPVGEKSPVGAEAEELIRAEGIGVRFHLSDGWFGRGKRRLQAVDDISFTLRRGQTIGIVGESGSGKSTLARALLHMVRSAGEIRFKGEVLSHDHEAGLRTLRRNMQIVFQDPFGSLSPRMTVGQIVTEGLLVHRPELSSAVRDRRAVEALAEVQLDPALRNRYPHEFSGGQRQRIAIARAMILKPEVLILDEPTSALDRTVQSQIVALLKSLQITHGLSYIFISHDLAVVRAMADTIMVMRGGKLVEEGPTAKIFDAPDDAYTSALITAAFNRNLIEGAAHS